MNARLADGELVIATLFDLVADERQLYIQLSHPIQEFGGYPVPRKVVLASDGTSLGEAPHQFGIDSSVAYVEYQSAVRLRMRAGQRAIDDLDGSVINSREAGLEITVVELCYQEILNAGVRDRYVFLRWRLPEQT